MVCHFVSLLSKKCSGCGASPELTSLGLKLPDNRELTGKIRRFGDSSENIP
jgi:hypothetical protein